MTAVHGKGTKILVDEYDLSAYLSQIGYSGKVQAVNVTTFGNDDERYLAGLGSGSINTSGVYDDTTGAVDSVLNTALSGADLVVTISPQGAVAVGDRAVVAQVREASYTPSGSKSDAVRIAATFDADGGLKHGLVLHELAAEAAAANFASVDNAASTAFGAVANVHVTAFTGTNATVKITDSTDDATFADLITFTVATGVTSERKTVAGTVNRYTRVELTGTFTTVTFAVSFARLTR